MARKKAASKAATITTKVSEEEREQKELHDKLLNEWNNDPSIRNLFRYYKRPQYVQGHWRFYPRHSVELLHAMTYKLIRAHDYEAAVKTLSVLYLSFKITPLQCVQLSLEIMNQQESSAEHVLHYFQALLEANFKDNEFKTTLLQKETLLIFMQYGRYREAYYYFQDRINHERFKDDVELLGTYGILCYWFFATENHKFMSAIKEESDSDDDEHIMATQSNHGVFQDAVYYLRRAIDLSRAVYNSRFLEYYIQLLVFTGNINEAADYLEYNYSNNLDCPFSCRIFAQFLEKYFPESFGAQCAVYQSWTQADPSAHDALQTLSTKYYKETGVCSTIEYLECLLMQMDHVTTNGSDSIQCWMWEDLAEIINTESNSCSVLDKKLLFTNRLWWKRVFFVKNSSSSTTLDDLHKAAVAQFLFGKDNDFTTFVLSEEQYNNRTDSTSQSLFDTLCKKFNLTCSSSSTIVKTAPIPPASFVAPLEESDIRWPKSASNVYVPRLLERHEVLLSKTLASQVVAIDNEEVHEESSVSYFTPVELDSIDTICNKVEEYHREMKRLRSG